MHSLKKDTLAYQLGVRPSVQLILRVDVPVPRVVSQLNEFMACDNLGVWAGELLFKEGVKGSPERDAVVFYMLNHAMSVIRQKVHRHEALGAYMPLVEEYHSQLATRVTRMFYYMLLICTRESRHERSSYSSALWLSLKSKYGLTIVNFHTKIKGKGSTEAAAMFRNEPPQAGMGGYTSFLSDVFHGGDYSNGYGGKAWGAVADVLRDFVHGKITAEMMMDTAFTLCHNNGPIFNKGMLFDGYSNEIYKILDVQRSGQIPQLISNHEIGLSNDPLISTLAGRCSTLLGSEFTGYVDWFMVEELGALHKYPNEKQKQISKHGYPSKFKAKMEVEQAKKELAAKQALEAEQGMVEIMVGLKLKKVEVQRG